MDGGEGLTALKRAYADIILNTAKEAAARIMLSERRALKFEFELNNAKDDALQMLMKLKQTMDFKISEAEMASCTQQKKIEELEAQLQEAEDIVKDLREELSSVQSELERFPKGESEKNRQNSPKSIISPSTQSQSPLPSSETEKSNTDHSKVHGVYTSLFPLKKCYMGNASLPSIILRSKETELFRNGCTHRIRACERTPLASERSFTDAAAEKLRKGPSVGADIVCEMEEKEVVLDESRGRCRCEVDTDKSRERTGPCRNTRPMCQSQTMVEVKEMDSCLTSVSSVKRVNGTAIDGNSNEDTDTDTDLVGVCDVQSSIRQEKADLTQKSNAQVDFTSGNSESKSLETVEAPIQTVNDRVIKYTFQRKRKRGGLSTSGNTFTERSKNLQRKDEESTQTKRCIEQIDRQLISLSDEKRWQ